MLKASENIIPEPLDEEVVLHKAEKPWIPMAKRDNSGMISEEAQAAELYRKFLSILNKLTPQKFQALAEQALKLEINTEERLNGCIDMIFTKALKEPIYSIAYANLCKVMSPIKVEYQSEDGKAKQTNFRRMLLTKCQKEFDKGKKDFESRESMHKEIDNAETDSKRAALKEELEFAITKSRKRSLENLRFIGELFKLQMLSETIMHECITHLLKSTSDEDSLECCAMLITITGKDLDKEQAKGRIDAYFKRIIDIIKKGMICPRVRFMLQDVLELRENSWVPRVRQDKQLKTIDQIHAEAAIEEAKEKGIVQHPQDSMKGAAGGRDSRRGFKDDHMTKDRDHCTRERENFDRTKLNKFNSSTRKDKGSGGQGHRGSQSVLRPGWRKKEPSSTQQTSEGSKLGGKTMSS